MKILLALECWSKPEGMAKSIDQKLEQKRAALRERTAAALGVSEAEAVRLLSMGRQQSVRVNLLKTPYGVAVQELTDLGWSGTQYTWCPEGLTVLTGLQAIRDSVAVAEGRVFIQNAASWLPVIALDPHPGDHILDMCAAPGGKTSHIAAMAGNRAHITANDNSRPRLAKLRANLDRLGVQNVTYTLYDAGQLAQRLAGQRFDKILLDAPCSGEGMLNYTSNKDMSTWSVAHVKRLQQLQKRLILQAWQLLKPGGTLVYSTCTIAPEENEAVIDYMLRRSLDATLVLQKYSLPNQATPVLSWNQKSYDAQVARVVRLAPGSQAEAFFVAKITKSVNT